jgi:hypothetical protein
MAESKSPIGQLADAFEVATAVHMENLTKLKGEVLRVKAECAQKYDALMKDVQKHLDNMSAMMDELRPKIRGLQQLEKKSSAKPTAKKPAKRRA